MRYLITIVVLTLIVQQSTTIPAGNPTGREAQATDINAVVEAMQDEIYDRNAQKEFWGFETAGPRGPAAEFNIYVKPQLIPEVGGLGGIVIYKYLPFGEVIRPFIIAPNGTAYLLGDPESGFSWNQPSTKTIYMDDEEICRDKHDWRKVPFLLDLAPSAARIKDAAEGQKRRVGFSQRELSITHRK